MIMLSERSIEIVAKTIYGEARGEYFSKTGGLPSLIAVANVIYNRYNMSGEKLIENICIKPKQFSCWNANDPNFRLISSMNNENDDPVYSICKTVTHNVISGSWPDITKGSTHYYSRRLTNPPYWAVSASVNIIIGNHVFMSVA